MIDFLFPPKCIFCGVAMEMGTEVCICENCFPGIPFMERGSERESNSIFQGKYCDGVICACRYTGMVKQAMIRYKFLQRASYYTTFAKLLEDCVKEVTNFSKFDIIISVPLYRAKERVRGYNQAFLVSMLLSKTLGILEGSDLLEKTRDTGKQSMMGKSRRQTNVTNAFCVKNAEEVTGKTILLIDDVLTTGSTVEECSRVLKEAGAIEVMAAVIASGRKGKQMG